MNLGNKFKNEISRIGGLITIQCELRHGEGLENFIYLKRDV